MSEATYEAVTTLHRDVTILRDKVSALSADKEHLVYIIGQIKNSLPSNKDWLDPFLETMMDKALEEDKRLQGSDS